MIIKAKQVLTKPLLWPVNAPLTVFSFTVFMCLAGGIRNNRKSLLDFRIVTTLLGYLWFMVLLFLICLHKKKIKIPKQEMDVEKLSSTSFPVAPPENIYENSNELLEKTQL